MVNDHLPRIELILKGAQICGVIVDGLWLRGAIKVETQTNDGGILVTATMLTQELTTAQYQPVNYYAATKRTARLFEQLPQAVLATLPDVFELGISARRAKQLLAESHGAAGRI
jgi:hypothetical protein